MMIYHDYQRYQRLLMTRPAGYVIIAVTDHFAFATGCIPNRMARETIVVIIMVLIVVKDCYDCYDNG